MDILRLQKDPEVDTGSCSCCTEDCQNELFLLQCVLPYCWKIWFQVSSSIIKHLYANLITDLIQ